MPLLIPPGYAGIVPLTITNPSGTLTLGGSTTTPVAAASTDAVVTCQLTGGQASVVYAGAQDQTAFGDVTAWWVDGSGGQHQLDSDRDTTSNGAWSAAQVTLRFRLQAAIAPGASDTSYFIAFGNPTPVVAQDWANIYPFWDRFAGTSLNGTKWSSTVNSGCSLTVNDGLTMTAPAGNTGQVVLQGKSPYTFGAGTLVEWLGVLGPICPSGRTVGGFSPGNTTPLIWAGGWGSGGSTLAATTTLLQINSGPSGFHSAALASPGDSSAHWMRVGRDPTGGCYAYLDAHSASVTGVPIATALAVTLLCWPLSANALGSTTLSAQWLKLRPWNGPGTDAGVVAGAVTYRSGQVLTPSPAAQPLLRAGAPSIVRSDASTWLALYSDGTHAAARRGGSVAALAAAPDQTALSSAAGVRGAALLSTAAGTVVLVAAQTDGTPAVAVYGGPGPSWGAGTATGLPSGGVFAGETYVATSGSPPATVTAWHLLGAAASGTSIQHWVATTAGGPWTALSGATVVALPTTDPCLAAAGYAGDLVAAAINGQGYLTYAALDALGATSGGGTVAASTLAPTNGALATSENLALLGSLDNGAGDLYVAYNNNLGLCVRISAAGGPLSWSGETQVSGTAADSCPTLVRDGTGAVTLFWIGGASGAGNPIFSQRLQVVGGTLYVTGSTLEQTNYAATRSLLSCAPSEPSGLAGLIWLES